MEILIHQIKLSLLQGDITKQATDAIVNAVNSCLMGGGQTNGRILREGAANGGGMSVSKMSREILKHD